jgi:hypothetical protein
LSSGIKGNKIYFKETFSERFGLIYDMGKNYMIWYTKTNGSRGCNILDRRY